jgi:hypothetical protein
MNHQHQKASSNVRCKGLEQVACQQARRTEIA